jgi:acetyl esterase/lipase
MRIFLLGLLSALPGLAQPAPQRVELLWPNGTPGAVGTEDADRPSLTLWPAANPRGTGVIVCPGGGYRALAMDHEGRQVAEWLNSLGLSAFVLKYRLGPRYRHPAPLQDAQRAIRWVRQRAGEFGVKPNQIGIWGFSAGGHLASTAGTHFDSGNPTAAEPLERQSSRPDFLVLGYPVISFTTEYTHKGSRRNLLGEPADPKLAALLSNETQVTAQTPPTFLFHTNADAGVPPENSVLFYLALRKAGVPAEMHIYEQGRHGVGLAPTNAVLSSWPARLADWLRVRGLL